MRDFYWFILFLRVALWIRCATAFLSFCQPNLFAQTIFNVPPDEPPTQIEAGVEVHIGEGGVFSGRYVAGGTLNVRGGEVDSALVVSSGGHVTLHDGLIRGFVEINDSSLTVWGEKSKAF